MLKSMTGFGKATGTYKKKNISIEIKSLNSKYLDLNLRLPSLFKEKELEIRNLLNDEVQRGKIDLYFNIELDSSEEMQAINKALLKNYYKELNKISKDLNISHSDLLPTLLSLPNVIQSPKEEIDAREWKKMQSMLNKAVKELNKFRKDEGGAIEKDLLKHLGEIEHLSKAIRRQSPERAEYIRNKLHKNLNEFVTDSNYDENRLEQELIFYLEKLDITEEMNRLQSHCEYFRSTLKTRKDQKGKKLNFISQELGREINTIGSKANHAEIQKLVIQMKDELEKMKEQTMNVL